MEENKENSLVKDNRFSSIEDQLKHMYDRQMEFCQSRSKMQISKFIMGEEYTLTTKYRTLAHNSYVAMQEVRRMLIDKERKQREINLKQKDINNNDKNYDLDIYELSRQIEDMEIRIKGLLKEIDYMEYLCAELVRQNGKPFTYSQLEEEENIYWERRLANQMHSSQIGNKLGIGEGNYHSYLMAIESPIIPENTQIKPFNIQDINVLATIALKDRKGVGDVLLAPPPVVNEDNIVINTINFYISSVKNGNIGEIDIPTFKECMKPVIKYMEKEITFEQYNSYCIQKSLPIRFTEKGLIEAIKDIDYIKEAMSSLNIKVR